MKKSVFYLMAIMVIFATACSGDEDKSVSVTGVTVEPLTLSIDPGEMRIIKATVAPGNAANKEVLWSTSDDEVATISLYGEVTAVAPGTATITVTTKDGGHRATCAVTVKSVSVTGITISPTSMTLEEGETAAIVPNVAPANASDRSVTWSSGNESSATVDADGVVTAVKKGTAVITAKTVDGNFTATCNVTVEEFIPEMSNLEKLLVGTGSKTWTWDPDNESLSSHGGGIIQQGGWGVGDYWYHWPIANLVSYGAPRHEGCGEGATMTFSYSVENQEAIFSVKVNYTQEVSGFYPAEEEGTYTVEDTPHLDGNDEVWSVGRIKLDRDESGVPIGSILPKYRINQADLEVIWWWEIVQLTETKMALTQTGASTTGFDVGEPTGGTGWTVFFKTVE